MNESELNVKLKKKIHMNIEYFSALSFVQQHTVHEQNHTPLVFDCFDLFHPFTISPYAVSSSYVDKATTLLFTLYWVVKISRQMKFLSITVSYKLRPILFTHIRDARTHTFARLHKIGIVQCTESPHTRRLIAAD